VSFRECDIVRVVQLGRIGCRNTEGSVPPEWAVGQEAIFDAYLNDGSVMVWLNEPQDGWQMWIFEEPDLEGTGKVALALPDDPGDAV
jgi:hypothetical protein